MKIEISDQFKQDFKNILRKDFGVTEDQRTDEEIESELRDGAKSIEQKLNKEDTTK